MTKCISFAQLSFAMQNGGLKHHYIPFRGTLNEIYRNCIYSKDLQTVKHRCYVRTASLSRNIELFHLHYHHRHFTTLYFVCFVPIFISGVIHGTVVARWIVGQQVEQSILCQEHDSKAKFISLAHVFPEQV